MIQAHLHFTVVLSWDRKSIQNLLNMGVYKGMRALRVGKKKQLRQWTLPAVSICTSVLTKGLPLKRKGRHHGLPITNIYQHLSGIYLGPKPNLRLLEEGCSTIPHSPSSFKTKFKQYEQRYCQPARHSVNKRYGNCLHTKGRSWSQDFMIDGFWVYSSRYCEEMLSSASGKKKKNQVPLTSLKLNQLGFPNHCFGMLAMRILRELLSTLGN